MSGSEEKEAAMADQRKRYRVMNRTIKAGFFSDAQDKIEKAIQPMLDKEADAGWRLHSFQATDTSKGINLVFIWEDDR